MQESEIEKHLCTEAVRRGFLCWKFPASHLSGVPDRILIGHGQVIFVETKAPGKKPSAIQALRHRQIRAHGGTVYVPDNKKDIDQIFNRFSEKHAA